MSWFEDFIIAAGAIKDHEDAQNKKNSKINKKSGKDNKSALNSKSGSTKKKK